MLVQTSQPAQDFTIVLRAQDCMVSNPNFKWALEDGLNASDRVLRWIAAAVLCRSEFGLYDGNNPAINDPAITTTPNQLMLVTCAFERERDCEIRGLLAGALYRRGHRSAEVVQAIRDASGRDQVAAVLCPLLEKQTK